MKRALLYRKTSHINNMTLAHSCLHEVTRKQLGENRRLIIQISKLSFHPLGIASIGTTCRSIFGSALSNDIGVGSALIVTHELAHT